MKQEIDRYVQGLESAFFTRKMRPKFHFSSPAGWMNDPHAPVWYHGEYHLFFNYYPYDTQGIRPKCWGHAVTKDFTSYRLLPTAIAPDSEYDRDGCASGCAVVHDDKLYLIYTGRNYYRRPQEVQCIAYSGDGIHFMKEAKNPVVWPPNPSQKDFRDPFVYRKDSRWQMLLGGKQGKTPCLYRYESENLTEWSYDGIFATAGAGDGTVWECPSLHETDPAPILLLSPENIDGVIQKSLYFFGEKRADTFYPTGRREIDYGCDYYAAQFFQSPDGQTLVNAWMHKWDNDHLTRRDGWIGAMTTPRTFFWEPGGKIKGEFLNSLKNLRKNKSVLQNIKLGPSRNYPLAGEKTSFWMEIFLEWNHWQGTCFEIGLLTDGTEKSGLWIRFEKKLSRLIIENHTADHQQCHRLLPLEPGFWRQNLHMDILVDVSCVEFSVNEEIFVTDCVYPAQYDKGIHFCKSDRTPEAFQVVLYDMEPAQFSFQMEA